MAQDSIVSHSPCESSCEVNDFGQIATSNLVLYHLVGAFNYLLNLLTMLHLVCHSSEVEANDNECYRKKNLIPK